MFAVHLLFVGLCLICCGATVKLFRHARDRHDPEPRARSLWWLACAVAAAYMGAAVLINACVGDKLRLIAPPVNALSCCLMVLGAGWGWVWAAGACANRSKGRRIHVQGRLRRRFGRGGGGITAGFLLAAVLLLPGCIFGGGSELSRVYRAKEQYTILLETMGRLRDNGSLSQATVDKTLPYHLVADGAMREWELAAKSKQDPASARSRFQSAVFVMEQVVSTLRPPPAGTTLPTTRSTDESDRLNVPGIGPGRVEAGGNGHP